MKRSEFEAKLKDLANKLKSRIELAPVPAFLVGIAIGVLLILFRNLLLPLVALLAIVAVVLWLIADKDSGPAGSVN